MTVKISGIKVKRKMELVSRMPFRPHGAQFFPHTKQSPLLPIRKRESHVLQQQQACQSIVPFTSFTNRTAFGSSVSVLRSNL